MNILSIFNLKLAVDNWRNLEFGFIYANSNTWNAFEASKNGGVAYNLDPVLKWFRQLICLA